MLKEVESNHFHGEQYSYRLAKQTEYWKANCIPPKRKKKSQVNISPMSL